MKQTVDVAAYIWPAYTGAAPLRNFRDIRGPAARSGAMWMRQTRR